MTKNKFPNIFSKGKIGNRETKNRVKYAACSVSNFNTKDGFITDREYARMEVIVRTDCGIITNQGVYPDKKGEGKAYFRQLSLNDDKYIPGLRKVADMIHENSAIAIQQILHGGRYGGIDLDYCVQPSKVSQTLRHFRPPKEMTKQEIKKCINEHADAARRAIEAGFDGVEITSFMGYLISNFNSKFTNKRKDEYGGSIENRAKFMCELIGETRDVIGKENLFIIRLNGIELMDEFGGNTPKECLEFMKIAEREGVDCISFVIGWHESRTGALGRELPSDHWLYLAENAKKEIKVPIAFGPRFGDPILAEKAIAEKKIDFWEVCRPFLADPELLYKVKENRINEIKPCMGGLLCLARMFRNLPYICTVNPQLGHEREYKVKEAVIKKKVAVIGAGPAGIECAIIAKKRGHDVLIFEKENKIGGQLNLAEKEIDGGHAFKELISYYETQIKKLKIPIILNREVDKDDFNKLDSDVIVIATGAVISTPKFFEKKLNIFNAFDVLGGKANVGKNVIILGGERAGLVTGEFLSKKGKNVTIVEEGKRIANDVIPTFKWRHYLWVKQFGIETITNAKIEFKNDSIIINNEIKNPDSIIVASPRKPIQNLFKLEFYFDEIYIIGDAIMPRSLHNAIHEGFKLGIRI